MKRINTQSLVVCALTALLGSVAWAGKAGGTALPVNTSSTTALVVPIQVSPATLVLGAPCEWVTIHADIAYSLVDRETIDLNGVPAAVVFADTQGNLVAKFPFGTIEALAAPPEIALTFNGATDAGEPFVGTAVIPVRPIGKR